MGGVDSDAPSGGNAAQRATSTLLLSDATDRPGACPDGADVLVVSTERTVREVVSDWRGDDPASASRLGLVTFAEFDRSAASTDRPSRRSLPGADITLTAMSDPSDLQRLGTAVTLYLDDWSDGEETCVYVDALAPFVASSGLEPTFQFLHLLVQTAERFGATLIVRLDPTDVDDRTTNTLRSLFDEVIEPAADGPSDAALDVDTVHDLLGNARRRFVLRCLYEESAMDLGRLASRLACRENETTDPTSEDRERARTALASVHLPRLADAGVVSFDRSRGQVRLSASARDADRLRTLLDRPFED